MSGRLVGEVLDNAPEDLTRLQFDVLIALAESARDTTRIATHKTTREALAYRCRTSPQMVKKVIAVLTARGLIKPVNGHVHRGKARHWELMKLTPDHRRAIWKGGPPGTPTQPP